MTQLVQLSLWRLWDKARNPLGARTRHHKTRLLLEPLEDRVLLDHALCAAIEHCHDDEHDHDGHLTETGQIVSDAAGNQYYLDPIPVIDPEVYVPPALAAVVNGDDNAAIIQAGLALPALHSNPSAVYTIFLDFDGHNVSGTLWNNLNNGNTIHAAAYSTDADIFNFSSAEIANITEIWRRVAEDFAPFHVDVTTVDPGIAAFQTGGRAIRILISNDRDEATLGGTGNQWFANAGGVAYLNSWSWGNDTPAWVFENNLGNGYEKYVAEAISHEAGHTFGLSHDGDASTAYYQGHGSGITGWAPIMGVGYSRALTQWSKGEYAGANNREDDLAMIARSVGYRADDHGNTTSSATVLVANNGTATASGVITTSADVDMFTFTTSGGTVSFDIQPFYDADGKANLDIQARVYDETGRLLDTSNPAGRLDAIFNISLTAGQYFLQIDGAGNGVPSNGYSDYGSLGQYSITATGINTGPGTATLLSPNGTIHNSVPTFEWTAAEKASRYELWVSNQDTNELVIHESDLAGTTFTPTNTLTGGVYHFWVRAFDSDGLAGAWSEGMGFTVSNLPGNTTPVSPNGTVHDGTPTFEWTAAGNAVRYELWVSHQSSNQLVIHETDLSGTTFTPTTALVSGSYQFWVRAFNSDDEASSWSQAMGFTLTTQPGTPTLLAPSSPFHDNTPTLEWTAAENGSRYEIWVNDAATSRRVVHDTQVAGTSFTPTTPLASGHYRYWIRAFNSAGEAGTWSAAADFIIDTQPGSTSLLSPTGTVFDETPTFEWTAAANATRYELWVSHKNTNQLVIHETDLTGTSFTAPTALAGGTYNVWVRALNDVGEAGAWSANTPFNISDGPGIATLVGPTNTNDDTPTFAWNAAERAVRYEIWVSDANTNARVLHDSNITGTTFTGTVPLTPGNYRYWIRAFSANGSAGAWSEYLDFSITETATDEDRYEDNDSFLTAYDLSDYENAWLSSIADVGRQHDEDWYKIQADANARRLAISLTFRHAEGDIDLALYNEEGRFLAASWSVTDNEAIVHDLTSAGSYFVRVYYGDRGNEYDLWWDDLTN